MYRLLVGAVTAAGSLALVGGAMVATAAPSAASDGGGNSAYGASAPAGVVTSPPLALATAGGPNVVTVRNMRISDLLTTGLTQDMASTVTAFSRVDSVRVSRAADGDSVLLTADEISSTCRSDSRTANASIVHGVLKVDGMITHLPQHPSAGQTIPVDGLGTLVMNEQISAPGDGVEVQGAVLRLGDVGGPMMSGLEMDGILTQDLYLAVSVCSNPGDVGNTVAVTNPGGQTSDAASAITPLPIFATDTDPGQVITYTATGLPPGLSIDSATGVITGTPTTDTGSPFTVTVTATDTSGASGSTTFTWFINDSS
jgi:hypothetical protein